MTTPMLTRLTDMTQASAIDREGLVEVTQAAKLLPCPFCGGPADQPFFGDAVQCQHCFAEARSAYAWNARVTAQEPLREALQRLTTALDTLSPISTHDTPDYAELTFGDHQTQAMTMMPGDWNEVAEAYHAARTALGLDQSSGK